jgi:hypothetical protein
VKKDAVLQEAVVGIPIFLILLPIISCLLGFGAYRLRSVALAWRFRRTWSQGKMGVFVYPIAELERTRGLSSTCRSV